MTLEQSKYTYVCVFSILSLLLKLKMCNLLICYSQLHAKTINRLCSVRLYNNKKKNQPKNLNTLLCFIQLLCLYAFYKMPIRTMPIRLEPINHLTPIVTNLLLLQTHVGSRRFRHSTSLIYISTATPVIS